MKRGLFTVVLFVFVFFSAFAQKKELTVRDAIIGAWTYLYPEYLQDLQWQGENDNYSFVDDKSLNVVNLKSGKKTVVLELEFLNKILGSNGIEEPKYFPQIEWVNGQTIQFTSGNHYIWYDTKEKKLTLDLVFSENGENTDFCKANKKLAFTVENNIFITNENGKQTPVTKDQDKGIVNGQTVHRNEFGIEKGIFWSPAGSYLAYYRKDETMVSDYPLVDISKRIAEVKNTKYPMAGMKSEEVTLGIYNVTTAKTIFLKTGEPVEQFLTNITWSPDEKFIYIAVLNREQNNLKFNQYDAVTGNFVKTLFEEKNERYVEPEHPALFLPGQSDKFLWYSERDGWNHLYLYSVSSGTCTQMTKGEWMVTGVPGFDPSGSKLFYTSTEQSPIENHLYALDIASGNITKISGDEGTHGFILSPSGKYVIDKYSSLKVPNAYKVLDAEGKTVKEILTAADPMKDYQLGEMKIGTIKAADGKTDLYYRMILPVNFDPAKKYPAIIYVYGGPHAQLITDSWLGSAGLWQNMMAQKGYVMLTVDNRGSANRGFEFESVIHRNLGTIEVDDQMKGVDFLKSLGYVDSTRIGVHGWSYGGFLTTSLMLKHNDVFKVGVAGGPVMDWKYYEVMYGERYMDMPQENPEGYKNACLTGKTDLLKGKLLIIHGYMDNTVVPQHSLDFIENCIKNNKQVDFFFYPTAEHNVYGYDRVHLMQKVTDYFEEYLK